MGRHFPKMTKEQKKILSAYTSTCLSWDDLPKSVQKALEKIKVYENMCADVDRYLMDARFEANRKADRF